MANITITNCDTGSVALGGEEFEDGLLTLAAGGIIPAGIPCVGAAPANRGSGYSLCSVTVTSGSDMSIAASSSLCPSYTSVMVSYRLFQYPTM